MRKLKELRALIPDEDLSKIIIIIGELKDNLEDLVAEAEKNDIHITKEEAKAVVEWFNNQKPSNIPGVPIVPVPGASC